MANRIEPFAVTIPAGTTVAAFLKTNLPMQEGRVDLIQVRIPPGPSGLVGFRIAHSGQSVIPYTGERWFITDDDKLDWVTENYPQGNAWQLWAYNLDVYAHTIYVWMHISDAVTNLPQTVTPVVIEPIAVSEVEPILEEVA
jgi:hypothetical protein